MSSKQAENNRCPALKTCYKLSVITVIMFRTGIRNLGVWKFMTIASHFLPNQQIQRSLPNPRSI